MAPELVKGVTKVPELRKGDRVVVLSGKDAGKRGVIERVIRRNPAPTGRRSLFRRYSPRGGVYVVVEGINIVKRHTKPRQRTSQTDRMPRIQEGGILEIPAPLHISKVMLVCSHCDRPTRIKHAILEGGRRVRICRHCGEPQEGSGS
jgi:large subunit ribosomal protein L24